MKLHRIFTGILSIGIDLRETVVQYRKGNTSEALWHLAKGVGTAGFLMNGGEEETLLFRSGEALWSWGTVLLILL